MVQIPIVKQIFHLDGVHMLGEILCFFILVQVRAQELEDIPPVTKVFFIPVKYLGEEDLVLFRQYDHF